MTLHDTLVDRLRTLNPVPDPTDRFVGSAEAERLETMIDSRLAGQPAREERRPRRRHPAVALAVALFVVVALLLPLALLTGQSPETDDVATGTDIPRHPEALVPTGTQIVGAVDDGFVDAVADPSGRIWFAGPQLAQLDPGSTDLHVWHQGHDEAFAALAGIAPARGAGVWFWLLGGDGTLRWFDGEIYRDVVPSPPAAFGGRDEIGGVAEGPDGRLWASALEHGLFVWDGHEWTAVDDERPVPGAGAIQFADDGSLWVANVELTPFGMPFEILGRGLSQYDGENWRTFDATHTTVLGSRVITIDPLSDGTVWVGTETGVAFYDGAEWTGWTSAEIGLPGGASVDVGPDGTVWAASAGGVSGRVTVATWDSPEWSTYGPDDGLPARTGIRLVTPVATETTTLVGTAAGVFRLDGNAWSRVERGIDPNPPAVSADPAGEIELTGVDQVEVFGDSVWAWRRGSLWRRDGNDWTEVAGLPGTGRPVVSEGVIWVVRGGGLEWYEGGEWHPEVQLPEAIHVADLAAGPSGKLWAVYVGKGTPQRGLLRRTDSGWEVVEVGDPAGIGGDLSPWIGNILVTEDAVWVGGFDPWSPSVPGSLLRFDGSNWEAMAPTGTHLPAVQLATDPAGAVWVVLVGPPNGISMTCDRDYTLARFEDGQWEVFDEAPLSSPSASAADSTGLWVAGDIGGCSTGLSHFDGRTWTEQSKGWVSDVAVAPDGTVWYITTADQALHRIDPES